MPLTSLNLAAPFELQVDTAGGKIAAGGKLKIKVKATRKGGYAGEIKLEVKNLPAGVTPPAVAIAAGQNEVEIELAAATTAALGLKPDLSIAGTATGAANQTNATGKFGVEVVKKP